MNNEICTKLAMSKTKENLMRAFAGESQAKNRYIFAASEADKKGFYNVGFVFRFTSEQEESHAKVFYNYLKKASQRNIDVEANYPIDINEDVLSLLKDAQHNEMQEFENDYAKFSQIAQEEGFIEIAQKFKMIAEVEKTHSERFGELAKELEQGKLFVSDVDEKWMCLNCGYIYDGKKAPEKCPICQHEKGYFIRLALAPYTRD